MNEWTSCAHSWVLCPLQTPTSHLDPQAGSSPSGGHPSGSPPLEQICGGPGPLVFVFIKRGRWCPFEPGRCADPARSPAALHAQPLPPPWLTPPSKSAAYSRVRTPIRGDETERGGGAEGTQPPPSSRGDGAVPGGGGDRRAWLREGYSRRGPWGGQAEGGILGQPGTGCSAYAFREGVHGRGGHGRLVAERSRVGGEQGPPLPQGAGSPFVESGKPREAASVVSLAQGATGASGQDRDWEKTTLERCVSHRSGQKT